MRPSRHPSRRHPAAFSLVELMVVIAIMVTLAAVSIPAFNSMLKTTQLTTAGQQVIDQLTLARQVAMTRGLGVEVRFYKVSEANNTAASHVYRAVQSFSRQGAVNTPLSKPVYLPGDIVFLEDAVKSSITALPATTAAADAPALPVDGRSYQYISVRFKATGEAVIPTANSFITLASQQDSLRAAPQLPSNYTTVQIDPVNGAIRLFRP